MAIKLEKPLRGTETVLLVDDDPMIINVVNLMLSKLGYKPIAAENGDQAIAALKDPGNKIDIVLLDIVMPGEGGIKILYRIREFMPSIPIIMISGFAIDDLFAEALTSEVSGFIQKPFGAAGLSEKIRKILDGVTR